LRIVITGHISPLESSRSYGDRDNRNAHTHAAAIPGDARFPAENCGAC